MQNNYYLSIRHLLKISIISFLLLITAAAAWFYHDWHSFLRTPLIPADQSFDYRFKPGFGLKALTRDLQEQGFLKKTHYFTYLAYLHHQTRQLKAGHYLFAAGTTPEKLLQQMVEGRVIQYRFTIVEGWRFQEILTALSGLKEVQHQLKGLSTQEVMQRLKQLDLKLDSLEGWFFPETYQYTDGMSDTAILQRAYQLMKDRLMAVWQERDKDLPYQSPYDALIVASLIEKETAISAERSLVAAVIVNRLNQKMLLQIDPTVIYGLPKAKGELLSSRDLKEDTPYNTYLRRGLPPTPIAMPSMTSLQAAVHPAKVDYFYFVAKGDGSHYFSKTLQEQQKAITKYLLHNKPKQQVTSS